MVSRLIENEFVCQLLLSVDAFKRFHLKFDERKFFSHIRVNLEIATTNVHLHIILHKIFHYHHRNRNCEKIISSLTNM